MDYEIRELGAFRIAGISRPFTTVNGENYKKIPEFWEELGSQKKVEEIMQSSDPAVLSKEPAWASAWSSTKARNSSIT